MCIIFYLSAYVVQHTRNAVSLRSDDRLWCDRRLSHALHSRRRLDRSFHRSFNRRLNRSFNRRLNRSFNRRLNRGFNRRLNRSFNRRLDNGNDRGLYRVRGEIQVHDGVQNG